MLYCNCDIIINVFIIIIFFKCFKMFLREWKKVIERLYFLLWILMYLKVYIGRIVNLFWWFKYKLIFKCFFNKFLFKKLIDKL